MSAPELLMEGDVDVVSDERKEEVAGEHIVDQVLCPVLFRYECTVSVF